MRAWPWESKLGLGTPSNPSSGNGWGKYAAFDEFGHIVSSAASLAAARAATTSATAGGGVGRSSIHSNYWQRAGIRPYFIEAFSITASASQWGPSLLSSGGMSSDMTHPPDNTNVPSIMGTGSALVGSNNNDNWKLNPKKIARFAATTASLTVERYIGTASNYDLERHPYQDDAKKPSPSSPSSRGNRS